MRPSGIVWLVLLFAMPALTETRREDASGGALEVEINVLQAFRGIRYIRRQERHPHPQNIHILEADLAAKGIRFLTSEDNGEGPREVWTEKTRDFVGRVGAQAGINANFFIHDRKKHTDLLGLAVSQGRVVSEWDSNFQHGINISKDNQVAFVKRAGDAERGYSTFPEDVRLYNAVSGGPLLVLKGDVLPKTGGDIHPRTAVGLTEEDKLLLVVVDGRHQGYSRGMTIHELALLMKSLEARDALALDGGGSATMVLADPVARVLNVPLPFTLGEKANMGPPGLERAVGNSIAVFAEPLDESEL